MIEASVKLFLSKEHTVIKHNVTPLEAMFLCADHHKNVGHCPVEVIPGTEKQIEQEVTEEYQEKTGTRKIVDPKDEKKTIDADVFETKTRIVKGTRSDNEEIFRLTAKYGEKKVSSLTAKIRDLPKTFAEATKFGVGIKLATGGMSERGYATVSETTVA